jgi:hypothetical protein
MKHRRRRIERDDGEGNRAAEVRHRGRVVDAAESGGEEATVILYDNGKVTIVRKKRKSPMSEENTTAETTATTEATAESTATAENVEATSTATTETVGEAPPAAAPAGPLAPVIDQVVKQATETTLLGNPITTTGTFIARREDIEPDWTTRQVHPELLESRNAIVELKKACKDAKRAARDAKEELEDAVEEHFRKIEELSQPTLFNRTSSDRPAPPSTPASPDAKPSDIVNPGKPLPEVGQEDDAWRQDLVDALDLKSTVIEKLHDVGIHTLGDLQDYTDPAKNGGNPNKRITDVKGIGAAKAEKIELAMQSYWAKRAKAKEEAAAQKQAEPKKDGMEAQESSDEAPAGPKLFADEEAATA